MRKLILISAFLVAASVLAHAGDSRGLVLAANEVPAATAQPAVAQPVAAQPVAAQPVEAQPEATAQPAAQPEAAPEPQRQAAKPAKKKHVHTWRDDEAKARRIAARYGVYW